MSLMACATDEVIFTKYALEWVNCEEFAATTDGRNFAEYVLISTSVAIYD